MINFIILLKMSSYADKYYSERSLIHSYFYFMSKQRRNKTSTVEHLIYFKIGYRRAKYPAISCITMTPHCVTLLCCEKMTRLDIINTHILGASIHALPILFYNLCFYFTIHISNCSIRRIKSLDKQGDLACVELFFL